MKKYRSNGVSEYRSIGADLSDTPLLRHSDTVPRLLLLHGLLSGGVAWDGLRRELGPEVVAFAPNLAGYGGEPAAAEYTLEGLVDQLERLLQRDQPTHVLGHSMGGIVALALARRYPGRFERIGVVGLPVYETREDGLDFIHQRGLFHKALLHTDHISHHGCVAMYATRVLWTPAVPLFTPRQPKAHAQAAFHHTRASHNGSLDRVIFAGYVPELAAAVTTPVVALHGGRDRSAPIDRVREIARTRHWHFAAAPTANHQVIIERPPLVARWVRKRLLAGED